MRETKHTTTPWHVDPKAAEERFFEDVNILRHDGLAIAVCLHNGDILPPEPEANAAFIAEACNAYYDNQAALASHISALAERDAEIAKLRADRSELLDFVAKAQGVAMGVAMSGRAHPNPDGALMGIFNDGRNLVQKIAARSALSKGQEEGNG